MRETLEMQTIYPDMHALSVRSHFWVRLNVPSLVLLAIYFC